MTSGKEDASYVITMPRNDIEARTGRSFPARSRFNKKIVSATSFRAKLMMRRDTERLPMSRQDRSSRSRSRSLRHPWSPNLHPRFLPIIQRPILTILKYLLPTTFLLLLLGLYRFEPHLELAFYDRGFISKHITQLEPLAGCFEESNVSAFYNVSTHVYGPKRTELHAGMSMRMGLDCYDFAGTIRPSEEEGRGGRTSQELIVAEDKTQYHTYWRTDLVPFGPRQEWMLKSFFATQDLSTCRLILWTNGDLSQNAILQSYVTLYPHSFLVKVVDIPRLARGTALERNEVLETHDQKAWVDGDLIRLLVLWTYGGVWVDMDSLLTRDLHPLLEHEFVTQWDCYDKAYVPFNGALMRFHKHSPYLCEAFHIMASSPPPRASSTDWGSLLYFKLFRRLIASSIPPFKVLPFCFSDGRSCRLDNRLPDPFQPDNENGLWTFGLGMEEGGGLDQALKKVFGVHLHNQWQKNFPKDGWVERLLLKKFDDRLGEVGN